MSPRRVTVIIAEPDPLLADVVSAICSRNTFDVLARVATGADLNEACMTRQPDVVLSAARLGDGPLLGFLDHLPADTKMLVLVPALDLDEGVALLQAGAAGYLIHDISSAALAGAVRDVAGGGSPLEPGLARRVVGEWKRGAAASARPALSARELEVLGALADGLSTKAAARRLNLASKTVENHKSRIFQKLGVTTTAQAITVAIRTGLVPIR